MSASTPSSIHICLISDNLLANLIPVLMDRPSLAHLVLTKESQAKGKRFKELLIAHGIQCQDHVDAPSTGMAKLRQYAENLARELKEKHLGQSVTLNVTGGTKLMALAFLETFREYPDNIKVIYTDTEHGCLEVLNDRDTPSRPMNPVLDVPIYLTAHGFKWSHCTSDDVQWRIQVEERKALSQWLADNAPHLDGFLGALNALANSALDSSDHSLTQPTQRFKSSPKRQWLKALNKISAHGLLDWDGDVEITFRSADAARYLGGLWLEEYAWNITSHERPDDVRMSVVGEWESQSKAPARNEFDLLLVHGNRMLVVECKTLRFGVTESKDQDILNKLESLGRNAGGLFGSTLLLSARTLSSEALARAKAYNISVLQTNELANLQSWIKQWMRRCALAKAQAVNAYTSSGHKSTNATSTF